MMIIIIIIHVVHSHETRCSAAADQHSFPKSPMMGGFLFTAAVG
jgi:hypothetical protein